MTSARTRTRMIERLREQGIRDEAVIAAIAAVPRHIFVDEALAIRAYDDSPLPIGAGQTISQPYVVARMTELLRAGGHLHRVLEIGTGCGYQTAVLARLSRLVYTVERYRTLLREAEARFQSLQLTNIITKFGDGMLGWPEQAPFDRILVTAAAPEEPKPLLEQLKPSGVLVAPIGKGPIQKLCRYAGDGVGGFSVDILCEVRFVPLLEGVAREL